MIKSRVVYGEGVGKSGLLNRVAGEAVRVNELKLITVVDSGVPKWVGRHP